jgi:hypothetical protein
MNGLYTGKHRGGGSFAAVPQGLLGGGILTMVYFVLRHFHVAPSAIAAVVIVGFAAAVPLIVAHAYRVSRSITE